jgi:hypothetical protein
MIKSIGKFIIRLIVLLAFYTQANALMDTAKISIRVVDETGNPVEGARVGIGFGENSKRHEIPVVGLTGLDGKFSASESCNGYIGFNITKNGYYKSLGKYSYKDKSTIRWEPWNPEVTIIARKIENPVPMYAMSSISNGIDMPAAGKDVGFDLVKYDWVAPYGIGTNSDFVFNMVVINNGGNDFEYQLKLKFPGKYDGIQTFEEQRDNNSMFILQRKAPIDGYTKELSVYLKGLQRGGKMSWKDSRHYIFRIRSEEENGKFKRAMYGKIISDIKISHPSKLNGLPGIEFKYYLNPDYSTNLEYDPEKNLFELPIYKKMGIQ